MSLKSFALGLKMRAKLLFAFGSIILLSVLLVVFSTHSIKKIIALKKINEEVGAMEVYLEKMHHASKEFIYEEYKSNEFLINQKCAAIDKFNLNARRALEEIEKIRGMELLQDEKEQALFAVLSTALHDLKVNFDASIVLLQERGFKDTGLEGQLRQAIHKVEQSGFEFNKADLLTLRRNEKDFFLRKDLKYQTDFNNNLINFKNSVGTGSTKDATSILQEIHNYGLQFNTVVEIEKKIGLKETEGIRGALRNSFEDVEPVLEQFKTVVTRTNENQIASTSIILYSIFGLQLVGGFLLAIFYSNLLVAPIKEIRTAMQKLAQGIFPENLVVKTTEEIGQTKVAFNQFLERLSAATGFAEKLGNGNLLATYPDKFTNDVLAKSIIAMQAKLREADEKQTKINWVNVGAAKFSNILKNDDEGLSSLGDKIIKLLVTYSNANQGALYIFVKSAEEEFLERISTYAYGKKKFVDHRIPVGNGMIGQCFAEKSTIYLKEVPKDYVKITSGLGESIPRNILIVPLKNRDTVMGVIEMASFELMEAYQIEFIEKIAENIAMMLLNKQTEYETKKLLTESRERAHARMQQEEEMRQNSEELQATQEEMERQRNALQLEIRALKGKLNGFELEVSLN